MTIPIIGITSGSFCDNAQYPPGFFVRRNYTDAIAAAGGLPLVVPPMPADQNDMLRTLYDRIDGLLLTGGGDIDPGNYQEPRHETTDEIDPERDRLELQLIRWAREDSKPLLGICRGLQIVNVALGGVLYQDIPSQVATTIDHNASKAHAGWTHLAHDLHIEPDSDLAAVLGTTTLVTNSVHHQAIKLLASGLRPTGWSPDGLVEAIEGIGQDFLLGVQCHPEALFSATDPRWRALFSAFVEAAARKV